MELDESQKYMILNPENRHPLTCEQTLRTIKTPAPKKKCQNAAWSKSDVAPPNESANRCFSSPCVFLYSTKCAIANTTFTATSMMDTIHEFDCVDVSTHNPPKEITRPT